MTHAASRSIIGIIGDGQLALMLADALRARMVDFLCYSSSSDSPMALLYPAETTQNARYFQAEATVFTLENEFHTIDELSELLGEKKDKLFPDLASYSHFANKISQHKLYASLNLPTPQWMEVKDPDLSLIMEKFSFPFIVKAPAGGYDGKGVRVVRNPSEFNIVSDAFGLYEGKSLLIEQMVSIKKELAQGFIRNAEGNFTLLPLVETVQVNGICQFVHYPAPVSAKVATEIESILKTLMKNLVGIFNFEFFLDDEDRIFINEGAPRPHNSQHLTIDASAHSQFTLLADYLSQRKGLPQTVATKNSAMVNILGKSTGTGYELTLPKTDSGVSVHLKLYGKQTCSPGRKMGHVNLVDETATHNLTDIATRVFKEYHI
jgi:5-(carboxyamino)imidazole ribonucleotide synthase